MIRLLLDVGNTRIKYALDRGPMAAVVHEGDVARAMAWVLGDAGAVDELVFVDVTGAARAALGAQAARQLVSSAAACGVVNGYAEPATLGADRWAALIGARHLHEGPCVVVNAGTTMTLDALSSESIFLGGCIVPGFELMRGALAANTAQLALRPGEFSFFPDNTGDAIASGALNALAGAVERMCRYLADTGEGDPVIVLSGGNAPLLEPLLNGRAQLVDNLVLEGLVLIGASDV